MINDNKLRWFPLRIRNSSLPRLNLMLERLEMVKHRLAGEGVLMEVYAPVRFIKVSMTKMDFAPYLLNYVFVRSTFSRLVELKRNQDLFEPLRFVMHPAYDDKFNRRDEVVSIPDKTMADYQRVTESEKDNIIFLRDLQYAIKPSQTVHIKRVRGKRCVVLTICDQQAAAIVDVHRNNLRYLTDEEARELQRV